MDNIRVPDEGLYFRADFRPETLDESNRTVEMVFTTSAPGLRRDMNGEFFEVLDMSPSSVRLDRLNKGAPLLDTHSRDELSKVLGVVEGARLESDKLIGTVRFSKRADVEPYFQDVKDGILRNVSISYRVFSMAIEGASEKIPTYRVTDWEPREVSLVPIPFDASAQVRAAAADVPTRPDGASNLEMKMEDKVNQPKPGDVAEEAARKAQLEAEANSQIEAARNQAIKDERARASEISDAVRAAGLEMEYAAELISSGIGADKARKAVLEKMKERAPDVSGVRVQAGNDRRDNLRVGMSEALLHRAFPSDKLSDRAAEFRGLSLLDMARECLEAEGVRTRGMSRMEIASRAFHATGDFPIVTADVMGKTLRRSYQAANRTFTAWARQVTLPDFKEAKRVQIGDAPSLKEVKENGAFTHGTMGEGQEKYALKTYGRIVAVTRQLIINDDLSAFVRVPELFGRAAADNESEIVYGVLTGNPVMEDGVTLFHATHGNLGTAGAISTTTVSELRKLMRKQKNLANRPINIMPRFLVVGPDNETAANQFLNGDYVPTTDTTARDMTLRTLVPVVDPRIENSNWFVIADPAQIDTVEYAYLEGNQGVNIETEMGFDVDGMRIKCRHDFAAKAIDHRGVTKNAFAG